MFRTSFGNRTPSIKTSRAWSFLGALSFHTTNVATSARTPRPWFTKAEDELILKLLKEGHKWPHIGLTLGRKPVSVRGRYLDNLRLDDPDNLFTVNTNMRKAVHKARTEEIRRLIEDCGSSVNEVAQRLGCSTSNVLRNYQASCPPQRRIHVRTIQPYSESEIDTIASGLGRGSSSVEIAESLGSHRSSAAITRFISTTERLRILKPKLRRFTTAEDEAIKAAMAARTPMVRLAKQFDRGVRSIYDRARYLRDKARRDTTRTDATKSVPSVESVQLQNSPSEHQKPLAGRSLSEVGQRSTTLRTQERRTRRKMSNSWTPEEERLLLARPPGEKLDWDALAKLFPGRSPGALTARYHKLVRGSGLSFRKGYAPLASFQPREHLPTG